MERDRAFGPTDSRGRLSLHELLHTCRGYSEGEDDFGMEQTASDAGGDGEEGGLSGEDFDLAGAGDVGKVDGTAAADAGGGGLVGSDGGKLRQELAGVNEEGFDGSSFSCVGIGGEFECVPVVVGERDGGRDSSTRARIRSHSLRMNGFVFGFRCIPCFSLRTTGTE